MMKKMMSFVLSGAMVFAMGLNAYAAAEDEKTGTADLQLKDGGLTIINTLDAGEKGKLPPAFAAIAPLSIDFGEHAMTGTESYTTDENVGVVVQDARGLGKMSEWTVNVQLSKFSSDGGQNTTLAGAQLLFEAVEGSIVPSQAPEGMGMPTMQTNVTIGSASTAGRLFVSASSQQGGSAGLWGANWKPTLKVPALSAEEGAHNATLTWTVSIGI